MTSPLLSDSEMAALRSSAESSMQTDVLIYARSTQITPDGQKDVWTYTETVKGHLYSGLTPVITLVSGQMAAVGTVQCRVPVGTAINSGDHVTIASLTYVVSDTAPDDTWSAMLRCSLRLVE